MNNLVWFRNDLRASDNNSLFKASQNAEKLMAVYCIDPRQFAMNPQGFRKTEKFRAKFLLESLQDLKENLKKLNISLFVFFDTPENALPQVVREYSIDALFFQKEWTSEEIGVNQAVKNLLPTVKCVETYDQFLFHPSDIPFVSPQKIPEVFTEFRKKCENEATVKACVEVKSQAISNLVTTDGQKVRDRLPDLAELGFDDFLSHPDTAFPFSGGESHARARIKQYFFETENLSRYKQTRNGLVGESYSSKLSPWLANGCVSARTVYASVKRFEQEVCENEDTYWLIFELIWRDYFKYISLKHGNAIFKLDGILGHPYEWKFSNKAFRDWVNGNTREPFVNANMIELQRTGFMSNRGRQNVASFWVKEWEQDWRVAAAYFESMLIDYDVHSNYGNWMYNAGVGNDPRDRKFNIKRQAEMYDPKGRYQNLWLNAS